MNVSDPRLRLLLPKSRALPSTDGSTVADYACAAIRGLDRETLAVLVARAMGASLEEVAEHVGTQRHVVRDAERSGLRAIREHDAEVWRHTLVWFRESTTQGGLVVEAGPSLVVGQAELPMSVVWSILARAVRRYDGLQFGAEPVGDAAIVVYDGMTVRRDELSGVFRRKASLLRIDEATAVEGVPRAIAVGAPEFFDGVGMTTNELLYSRAWSVEEAVHAVVEWLAEAGPELPSASDIADLIAALLPDLRHETTESRVARLVAREADTIGRDGPVGRRSTVDGASERGAERARLRSEGDVWASQPVAQEPATAEGRNVERGSIDRPDADMTELERSVVEALVEEGRPLTAWQIASIIDRRRRDVHRSLHGSLVPKGVVVSVDGRRFRPNTEGEDHDV